MKFAYPRMGWDTSASAFLPHALSWFRGSGDLFHLPKEDVFSLFSFPDSWSCTGADCDPGGWPIYQRAVRQRLRRPLGRTPDSRGLEDPHRRRDRRDAMETGELRTFRRIEMEGLKRNANSKYIIICLKTHMSHIYDCVAISIL